MEDALYFILPNVKSKELLRTIFSMFVFFLHIFTQSKDFPLGSLTEGKKTIYHRNRRRMEDALYFILLDVKSKELLCIIFSMYAFFYIHSHNRKIFNQRCKIFNRRKENDLSSKRKKRKMKERGGEGR